MKGKRRGAERGRAEMDGTERGLECIGVYPWKCHADGCDGGDGGSGDGDWDGMGTEGVVGVGEVDQLG